MGPAQRKKKTNDTKCSRAGQKLCAKPGFALPGTTRHEPVLVLDLQHLAELHLQPQARALRRLRRAACRPGPGAPLRPVSGLKSESLSF